MICFLQCWCFWQSVAGAGVRWCLLITKCVPSCLLKMLFLNLFLWFSFHQKKKKTIFKLYEPLFDKFHIHFRYLSICVTRANKNKASPALWSSFLWSKHWEIGPEEWDSSVRHKDLLSPFYTALPLKLDLLNWRASEPALTSGSRNISLPKTKAPQPTLCELCCSILTLVLSLWFCNSII